jgi:hypothetical protein
MNVGRRVALVFTALLSAAPVAGQSSAAAHTPRAALQAMRVAQAPAIDGHLADESWGMAPAATQFTQQDPDEGQPATELTELKVIYDDAAIYIGIRMFDRAAARISPRLSTRDDEADADRITVYLDPMHDHKTGVEFSVSAANVQRDAVIFNDSWNDRTWDQAFRGHFRAGRDRRCSPRLETTCFW